MSLADIYNIDVELFKTVLELNGLTADISEYPIDSDGYPKFFSDTDTAYFQNFGLWYRETGGANSVIDIKTGNNPHVGPYDNGSAYLEQLRTLIPNFSPLTITSETVTTSSYDIFTNYNNGEITNYDGEIYVDVVNTDGSDLDGCVTAITTIETDPKPEIIVSPCGCPSTDEDDMLSICLEKTKGVEPPLACPPFDKAPEYNESGYYVFSLIQYNQDGSIYSGPSGQPIPNFTTFIGTDCCGTLNGVPMYTEFSTVGINGNLETVETGYICCAPNRPRCGCMASCNWIIKDIPYLIDGESYLDFTTLYGLGASTLVTADGTNCPAQWTTPIQIIDPYTGLQGMGCKIVDNTYLAFYPNLVSMFQDKAYKAEGLARCCDWDFMGSEVVGV
jgi:hypothetical protein